MSPQSFDFRFSAGRGRGVPAPAAALAERVLAGGQLGFYALAMPSMLGVTIAIAVFTYLCGRGMAARSSAHKTAFLRGGVIGLLAILAFLNITARSPVRAAGRP